MVGQRAVTPWLRQVGSIPSQPTKFRSLVKWILRWATDPQVGVQFSQDRPVWGIGANWEHMCFASMSKQFKSAILHHI